MHLYLSYIYIHYSNLYLLYLFLFIGLEVFDFENMTLKPEYKKCGRLK